MKKRVKCFQEAINGKGSYAIMDAGLRVVETGRIVGTVGKCGELDRSFHYLNRKDRHERSRRDAMFRALRENQFLPAVELYLLRGEYFVVDGNRRVAAAREMKIEFLDAHVTEYVPRKNGVEMGGVLARRRFEAETGIRTITLTHESGYGVLLAEVGRCSMDDGETDIACARKWYSETFLPACTRIEKSGLPARYPALRVGDLYVLVNEFYRTYLDGIPEGTGYDSIISGFMVAHGMRRRSLHLPMFRVMSAAVLNRGLRGSG
jgi:hypothetical protein